MKMQNVIGFIILAFSSLTSSSQVFYDHQRLTGYSFTNHSGIGEFNSNPIYAFDSAAIYYSGDAATFVDPLLEYLRMDIKGWRPIEFLGTEVLLTIFPQLIDIFPNAHLELEEFDNIKYDSLYGYLNSELYYKQTRTYNGNFISHCSEYYFVDNQWDLSTERIYFYNNEGDLEMVYSIEGYDVMDTTYYQFKHFDHKIVEAEHTGYITRAYEYDHEGRVIHQTFLSGEDDRLNGSFRFNYDGDKIQSIVQKESIELYPNTTVFTYENGLPVSAIGENDEHLLEYNQEDRLSKYYYFVPEVGTCLILSEYLYDEAGNLTFFKTWDGFDEHHLVDIDYDGDQNIFSITNYFYYEINQWVGATADQYTYDDHRNISTVKHIWYDSNNMKPDSIGDDTNLYLEESSSTTGTFYYEDYQIAGINTETIEIHAFPNPVNEILSIHIGNILYDTDLNIQLATLLGQVVLEDHVKLTKPYYLTLDCTELQGGFYILSVSDGTNVSWQKIIVN